MSRPFGCEWCSTLFRRDAIGHQHLIEELRFQHPALPIVPVGQHLVLLGRRDRLAGPLLALPESQPLPHATMSTCREVPYLNRNILDEVDFHGTGCVAIAV